MGTVDTNHDGTISAAEHAAYARAMFDTMDSNHDGNLSKAELDTGMKAMHPDKRKAQASATDNDHDADDVGAPAAAAM